MITQDKEKTKVVFRKFKDGEIIALFPEIEAAAGDKSACMSYMQKACQIKNIYIYQ